MPHSSSSPTQSSTSSQMPSASASAAVQSPPHTPRRRAGCRRSRSLLLGCQNIRTRRWRQDRCRCRTRRVRQRSRPRHRRCHRHRRPLQSPPHTPKASSWLPSQSQSPSLGCQNIRTRRWRQDRCRCRTRRSAHAVVDVVADAIGVRHAAQSPPHTPKARRAGPSQSQSPSGMSEHPHS